MRGLLPISVIAGFALGASASTALGQQAAPEQPRWSWPDTMQNRQALPEGTGGQQLRATMVGFSLGLDVECSFCHAPGDEFLGLAFASDANPRKEIARGMIRMVQRINAAELPAIPGLSQPRVTCYTCHRGSPTPAISPPVDE